MPKGNKANFQVPNLETSDTTRTSFDASFLIEGRGSRFPERRIANLAKQLISQNKSILDRFDIFLKCEYDGSSIQLIVITGTKIGALPLKSPTSGKYDYGLVIHPRYQWSGIGPIMGEMGWRVIPSLLNLPMLPHSERKIPPWVLSTIVLFRIKKLLQYLHRDFEMREKHLTQPKGRIKWTRYLTREIPRAKFLEVPCEFPELTDDPNLVGAIHYALRKHLASLESQRHMGITVARLISLCKRLLSQVSEVEPRRPSLNLFRRWQSMLLKTKVFEKGLQAIQWTIEERGLAGLSELQGIPWIMPMEEFFEAWVEFIVEKIAYKVGGKILTGRNRETVIPLKWDPPYRGSQRYLLPDIIMKGQDNIFVFDAKYKAHLKEIHSKRWYEITDQLREQHRADLLQILAYTSVFNNGEKVAACLFYPCNPDTWEKLKAKGDLFHHASLGYGSRQIGLLMTVVPISTTLIEKVVLSIVNEIKCFS